MRCDDQLQDGTDSFQNLEFRIRLNGFLPTSCKACQLVMKECISGQSIGVSTAMNEGVCGWSIDRSLLLW